MLTNLTGLNSATSGDPGCYKKYKIFSKDFKNINNKFGFVLIVIGDIYDMQQSKYWFVHISEDLLVTQQILIQAQG